MTIWDHLQPDDLHGAGQPPGGLNTGDRVTDGARHGTVSFTRSGFVRVQWDGGSRSDEWMPDLTREETP